MNVAWQFLCPLQARRAAAPFLILNVFPFPHVAFFAEVSGWLSPKFCSCCGVLFMKLKPASYLMKECATTGNKEGKRSGIEEKSQATVIKTYHKNKRNKR